MPEKLSDRTVLLAILLTLLIVMGLIFSTRPPNGDRQPPLQWRDQPPLDAATENRSGTLQI